jgi:hypothetical protein
MNPKGRVRLLDAADPHRQNHFGKELIGWKPISQGEGGLFNPIGFACLRVVVQKEVSNEMVDLYDQPLVVEDPGAVIVCQAGEKIGFVQSFRMVGERVSVDGGTYVASLNEGKRWTDLLNSLGQEKWELPRGVAPVGNADPAQAVLAIARQEALEEAGFVLKNVRVAGRINTNAPRKSWR